MKEPVFVEVGRVEVSKLISIVEVENAFRVRVHTSANPNTVDVKICSIR